MTQFAQSYYEEKIEAINQTRREERIAIAKNLLAEGEDPHRVMRLTGLALDEVNKIRASLEAKGA